MVYLQDADNCLATSTFGDCDAAIQADGVSELSLLFAWSHLITPNFYDQPKGRPGRRSWDAGRVGYCQGCLEIQCDGEIE
jgi:hypothetical protein